MSEEVYEVIGWRLDLVRNSYDWQGNQYLKFKEEFYALLSQTSIQNIYAIIYTDRYTFEKFYARWGREVGISNSNSKISIEVIELRTDSDKQSSIDGELSRRKLDGWLGAVDSIMQEKFKSLSDLGQEVPPKELDRYLIGQEDSAIAVWAEKSKAPEEHGSENEIFTKEAAIKARSEILFEFHLARQREQVKSGTSNN